MAARDRSLDYTKGLAILLVYLSHSIIYHPIKLNIMYDWCMTLETCIISFNMPVFFFISGYLFSRSSKGVFETLKGKFFRLFIPYVFTMLVVCASKLCLPASMSFNSAVKGGVGSLIENWLLYGGDRWFIYVLLLIFLVIAPIKEILGNIWVCIAIMAASMALYLFGIMPDIFRLDSFAHFLPFFIGGFCLKNFYPKLKELINKWWFIVVILFAVLNVAFVNQIKEIIVVYRIVLPVTGSLIVVLVACALEKTQQNNCISRYINYLGKYSLQFYLFTFAYPIIRVLVVSKLHVTNPFAIVGSVLVLQLICTTLIVEVTRRIKLFRIPCGY